MFRPFKILFISAFFYFLTVVLSQWYLSKGQTAAVGSICEVVPACALVTAEPASPLAEPVELCWLGNGADRSVWGFLPGLAEIWSKVVDTGRKKIGKQM